jgi:hypothetical protein
VTFEELPTIEDDDAIRRVHNTAGLYLLTKSRLTAHSAPFDCTEVDQVGWRKIVQNPSWRLATDVEVRAIGGGWCQHCSV